MLRFDLRQLSLGLWFRLIEKCNGIKCSCEMLNKQNTTYNNKPVCARHMVISTSVNGLQWNLELMMSVSFLITDLMLLNQSRLLILRVRKATNIIYRKNAKLSMTVRSGYIPNESYSFKSQMCILNLLGSHLFRKINRCNWESKI